MLRNLARMTTATTGTGTLTLVTNVASYLSFADAGVQNGEEVTYAILNGAQREIGRGVYTASGTTLSRVTILESTNAGSAINLVGDSEVFITPAAEDFPHESVKATKSSNQTGLTSGAETQITFGTENWDTHGKFASNAWTPTSGKKIFGLLAVHVDGAITEVRIIIKKGASSIIEFMWSGALASGNSAFVVPFADIADGSAYTFYADVTTSSGTWSIFDSDRTKVFGWAMGVF